MVKVQEQVINGRKKFKWFIKKMFILLIVMEKVEIIIYFLFIELVNINKSS